MAQYSTNFLQNSSTGAGSTKGFTNGAGDFGRVLDIILDENHPQYQNKGGGRSINGVFFRYESKKGIEDLATIEDFAYQGSGQIKTVPVVGELVSISSQPSPRKTKSIGVTALFYMSIVNVWNSPNCNPYLDVFSNPTLDIEKGGTFTEEPTINPIRSAVGDLQVEGRQGQSIRLTGAKGTANPWVDDSNKGKPVIIISNGQIDTDDGFTTITEDINKDSSSIYFISDHQIPLDQANQKRSAYDQPPTTAGQFKGNQILINSGRLFFNAKEQDMLLSSITSIGLNTGGSINMDASSYFCVDAPEILLGVKARTAPGNTKEPVLLGNQTEQLLQTLFKMLERMARDMARAKTVDKKPIPLLNKRGAQMQPVIKAMKRRINPTGPSRIKSKKVFTE